jgi:hypothetical protein
VLTDGFIGQMMEPVEFPSSMITPRPRLGLCGEGVRLGESDYVNLHGVSEDLERHVNHPEEKY